MAEKEARTTENRLNAICEEMRLAIEPWLGVRADIIPREVQKLVVWYNELSGHSWHPREQVTITDLAAGNVRTHSPAEWIKFSQENERLRAQLEVAESGYAAAVRTAQWQSHTNHEMNELSDRLRKLQTEYTKLANERIQEGL